MYRKYRMGLQLLDVTGDMRTASVIGKWENNLKQTEDKEIHENKPTNTAPLTDIAAAPSSPIPPENIQAKSMVEVLRGKIIKAEASLDQIDHYLDLAMPSDIKQLLNDHPNLPSSTKQLLQKELDAIGKAVVKTAAFVPPG